MADNCPGGVCNYGDQLKALGRTGYMDKYPEVFAPWTVGIEGGFGVPDWAKRGYEQRQRIEDLRDMMGEYGGPEGSFVRWVLRNMIEAQKRILGSVSTGYDYTPPRRDDPLPIPEWMQEYIVQEPIMPAERRRQIKGQERWQRERTAPALRPLSAQERLDPEQLQAMAGLQAYGKSMVHRRGLESMADISRWWTPFRTESQAMFSRGVNKPQWATASQR